LAARKYPPSFIVTSRAVLVFIVATPSQLLGFVNLQYKSQLPQTDPRDELRHGHVLYTKVDAPTFYTIHPVVKSVEQPLEQSAASC